MRIGEYQELEVVRETQHGYYLSDGEDDVLLPQGQIPRGLRVGDKARVFVYTDSEDRPIATTKNPYAAVGEFAVMRVVSEARIGAFLDWGIDKDLFCAMREQKFPMRTGERYLVRVYLDERSGRVAASSKVNNFLRQEGHSYKRGDKVDIIVAERLRDFMSLIVDGEFKGMLFPDEWHERLEVGDRRQAYVKQVRPEDGRLAISLRPQGYEAVLDEKGRLLEALEAAGGTLPVSDKSSPQEIQRRFGLSKGAFKKLIGTLYREGTILLTDDSISLK